MRPTKKAKALAVSDRGYDRLIPLAFLAALTALALALSGCNTMSGLGEDVSAAGGALDQTSERTQDKLSDEDEPSRAQSDDFQAGRY